MRFLVAAFRPLRDLSLLKIPSGGKNAIQADCEVFIGHPILIDRSLRARYCRQARRTEDGCAPRDEDRNLVRRRRSGRTSVAVMQAASGNATMGRTPGGSYRRLRGFPPSLLTEPESVRISGHRHPLILAAGPTTGTPMGLSNSFYGTDFNKTPSRRADSAVGRLVPVSHRATVLSSTPRRPASTF